MAYVTKHATIQNVNMITVIAKETNHLRNVHLVAIKSGLGISTVNRYVIMKPVKMMEEIAGMIQSI